jgi:prevent-host-death family protein
MIVTASKLRANIYNVLDKVLETGVAVEIHRKGKTLKIIPVDPPSKLSKLKKHDALNVPLDDIVHMDWSKEWKY